MILNGTVVLVDPRAGRSRHETSYSSLGRDLFDSIDAHNESIEDKKDHLEYPSSSPLKYSRDVIATARRRIASSRLSKYLGEKSMQEIKACTRRSLFDAEIMTIMQDVASRHKLIAVTEGLWAAYRAVLRCFGNAKKKSAEFTRMEGHGEEVENLMTSLQNPVTETQTQHVRRTKQSHRKQLEPKQSRRKQLEPRYGKELGSRSMPRNRSKHTEAAVSKKRKVRDVGPETHNGFKKRKVRSAEATFAHSESPPKYRRKLVKFAEMDEQDYGYGVHSGEEEDNPATGGRSQEQLQTSSSWEAVMETYRARRKKIRPLFPSDDENEEADQLERELRGQRVEGDHVGASEMVHERERLDEDQVDNETAADGYLEKGTKDTRKTDKDRLGSHREPSTQKVPRESSRNLRNRKYYVTTKEPSTRTSRKGTTERATRRGSGSRRPRQKK